jgi:hypothetical protein
MAYEGMDLCERCGRLAFLARGPQTLVVRALLREPRGGLSDV